MLDTSHQEVATPPKTVDTVLPSGLRFVGERIERSQAVALAIRIPAGAKDDPPNKFGLANLVKETLFKGTKKRDARKLSDAFDFYGIRHSEYTATETTVMQIRFLPEHLVKAIGLLREVLSQPAFPQKECETAKTQSLQELKHLEDDPFSKVAVVLKEIFFGSQWGHSDLGTETSVPEITRGDILNFWQAQFIPAGSVVAAAGKFDPDALAKELDTIFAKTSSPAWPVESPPPLPTTHLRKHLPKDSQQTQMTLAFPAVPHNHPDYYTLRTAVGVLSGGMSGRLFTEVREKRALVYSVGAHTVSLRGAGAVYVFAGTTTPRAAETLKVIKTELARLGDDVTQAEIERAKIALKAHLLMDQESTNHRAREMVDDVFFENRIVPLAEVIEKINRVTVADVKKYWAEHPWDPYTLVTLGQTELE
ncbi:MAG TPA: pitrilysin family protein [Planctomycetota bacterium]|nr:pitrilysin family protein [Planctomycetota bacterium]